MLIKVFDSEWFEPVGGIRLGTFWSSDNEENNTKIMFSTLTDDFHGTLRQMFIYGKTPDEVGEEINKQIKLFEGK